MNDSRQMKLILERWDKFILNEQDAPVFKRIPAPTGPINTVGELRTYFKMNASSNTMAKVLGKAKELADKYPVTSKIAKAALMAAVAAIAAAPATAVATGALALTVGAKAAAAVGAAAVAQTAGATALDLFNNAVLDTTVDTLGFQLMAIPDSELAQWGQLGKYFDINDKVFNFLYKAYGNQIPKEVSDASEALKNQIKATLAATPTYDDSKDIDEVFGGFDTIQQRVDALIASEHNVKIEQTP